jgi:hypothetical protein
MRTVFLMVAISVVAGCTSYGVTDRPGERRAAGFELTSQTPDRTQARVRICTEVGGGSKQWECEVWDCPEGGTPISQNFSCTLADKYGCDSGDDGCPESE